MFMNVIVGVDGRQGGRDAIALAALLAAPGAAITLAHLYGEGRKLGRGSGQYVSPEQIAAGEMLARERDAAGIDADLCLVCDPAIGQGLHRLADERSADLIVVGSSHRGQFGRVLLGDDVRSALDGAPCAVAIAPTGQTERGPLSRIGIGYDGSDESVQALEVGRGLAERYAAKLTTLSVISLQRIPYGEPIGTDLSKAAAELFEDEQRLLNALDDVDGDVMYGKAGEELARFSKRLDLLIVGSRSEGRLGRLLHGSTSVYLARHARSALLVMPRGARRPPTVPLVASVVHH
jgi:nucleotide-binding universal stress UspA family protein